MEENKYSSEELIGGIGKELHESVKDNIEKAVFFKSVSICILIIGFILGIICGGTYKVAKITYECPDIKLGEQLTKVFNFPLMMYIWIGVAILALSFWAMYCHLNNQEKIISILENK